MAPVPATITVNFIANYAGNHRIAYRPVVVPSVPYSFVTTPCVGGGTPCSGTIAITVDNETCDNVVYEGYVQAECELEISVNGRIPWTVTFSPNPVCDAYSITCNEVGGCDPIPALGNDCNGDPFPSLLGFDQDAVFYVCSEATPTPPTGYAVTALTRDEFCCYDCEQVTFAASGGSARIVYIDCTTRALIDTTLANGDDATVCVVAGSYYVGTNGTVSAPVACP
jgi:hypothetical protein